MMIDWEKKNILEIFDWIVCLCGSLSHFLSLGIGNEMFCAWHGRARDFEYELIIYVQHVLNYKTYE